MKSILTLYHMVDPSNISLPKQLPPLLDVPNIVKALNSPESLALVVRAHQCIELALNHLLDKMLLHKHVDLIVRLPFGFKSDLCIALGILPSSSRPAFLGINSIRNRFAHDFGANIDDSDIRNLRNILSAQLKNDVDAIQPPPSDAVESFSRISAVLYYHVVAWVNHVSEKKLYDEATEELVKETLAKSPIPMTPERRQTIDNDMKERVGKLKVRKSTTP